MREFTIELPPTTKKNHQEIIYVSGHPRIIQSKQYRKYEKEAAWYVPRLSIDRPINVEAVFYMQSRRRVDLVNLLQALCDVMVACGTITDDNAKVIVGFDGSRVDYDKKRPRTEVRISER